ncbi:MAG: SRPBCC domain-containing protein [Aggregatilineales bacterium]
MLLGGTFIFNAPQVAVWMALMDIEAIRMALGVHQLVPTGQARTWRAAVRFNLLFLNNTSSYLVQMSEVDAPHSYRLNVRGEGRNSLLSGSGVIRLCPLEDERTQLSWRAEGAFAGALRLIAPSIVQQAVSALSHSFFSRLAAHIRTSEAQTPLVANR